MFRKVNDEWAILLIEFVGFCIMMPGIFALMGLFEVVPNWAQWLLDMMGQIEGIDFLIDIYQTARDISFSALTDVYFEMMTYKTIILALCIETMDKLTKFLFGKKGDVGNGLKITAKLVGVLLGLFVLAGYADIPLLAVVFLAALLVFVDLVWFQEKDVSIAMFFLGYLKFALRILVKLAYMVFMLAYMLIIFCVWRYGVSDFHSVLLNALMCLIPWFFLMLLEKYVLSK